MLSLSALAQKGKALARSLALAATVFSAPAQAKSPSVNAPAHYREFNLSFSDNNNPSLEPLMLVNNAHTLESVLN